LGLKGLVVVVVDLENTISFSNIVARYCGLELKEDGSPTIFS
jgi:hypothetical protein